MKEKLILARYGQTLEQHSKEVCEYALRRSRLLGIDVNEYEVRMMCILHDIAKALPPFQQYIRGEKVDPKLKQHSILSGLIYYHHRGDIIPTIAILFHHSFLRNLKDIFQMFYDDNLNIKYFLKEQIKYIKNDKRTYNYIANLIGTKNLNDFLKNYDKTVKKLVTELRHLKLKDDIRLKTFASLLQNADKNTLISDSVYYPTSQDWGDNIQEYIFTLNKYNNNSNNKEDIIRKYQNIFAQEARDTIKKIDLDKDKILNLSLPTGGGKTIDSFEVANYLKRNLRGNRKIIYASSFLSIVQQVYNEYKKILQIKNIDKKRINSSTIIPFHSMSKKEIRKYVDDYREYEGFNSRQKIDSWQSDIVITTFAQFFNSILGMDKKVINRFTNLYNSIIILDEVQDIPIELQKLFAMMVNNMAEGMDCRFIFSTATQPYIIDDYIDLVSRDTIKEFLNKVNRVHMTFVHKTDINGFIRDIINSVRRNPDKSHLICLNTKESSRYVYKKLKKAGVADLHLSANTLPNIRRRKLKQIKNSKKPCVLVCTQIIETGVDISFDIGFRDFAPFNSLMQFPGRINRYGLLEKGNVYIYRLKHPEYGNYFCYNVYGRESLNITFYKILKKGSFDFEEKDFMRLYDKYIKYIKRAMSEINDEVLDNIIKQIRNGRYDKLKDFKLIEEIEYQDDYVVLYNNRLKNIIQKIKEIKNNLSNDIVKKYKQLDYLDRLWQILNNYTVSLNNKKVKKYKDFVRKDDDIDINILDKEGYNLIIDDFDFGDE